MFTHYAHFFLRSLLRQKVLSLVSIAGFALGLVCVFFTTRYVLYELSYDRFLKNSDRIFRINSLDSRTGELVAVAPFILGGRLKAEFPEIEDIVRTIDYRVTGRYAGRVFTKDKLTFADSSLIRFFGLEFLEGDPATALSSPGTVIVSRSISQKYFGNESPLGRVVEFDKEYRYVVRGVFKDIPHNSHLDLSFVSAMNSFAGFYGPGSETMTNTWDGAFGTYILLSKGASISRFNEKIPEFVERNAGQGKSRENRFTFQNVRDIHLYSAAIRFKEESAGDITTVYGLAAITILLLIIVSTNYIVMAVARIPTRLKEIGLRKVLGAGDTDLSRQFILEATLFCILSSLLAISVIELVFPVAKQYLGTVADAAPIEPSSYAIIFVTYCLTLGFVSGFVPAILTFRITPGGMLQRAFIGGSKSSSVRTLAVVIQLIICMSVISLAIVVYEQIAFVKNTDLGFTKEALLTIDVSNSKARSNLAGLRESISANRHFLGVTMASGVPPQDNDYTGVEGMTLHDGMKHMGTKYFGGEFNFAGILGLRIVKGRGFDQNHPTDANCIMINQAFAEEMGWDDPIGKDVVVYLAAGRPFKVIGVVQDFNFRSLHQKIEPVIMFLNYPQMKKMVVKVNQTSIADVTGFIRSEWKHLYPDEELSYSFVDDDFDSLYSAEEQQGRLLLISAAVAIFLALIGVLGMSLFNIQRRVKEIGIRKVLGASTNSLLMIQSRYYIGIILIAGILSLPISYYVSRSWLERFAYRIPDSPGEFLLSFLFVSVVTYFTPFVQILKSSGANPVDALRYE